MDILDLVACFSGTKDIDKISNSFDNATKSAKGFGSFIKGLAKYGIYFNVFQKIEQLFDILSISFVPLTFVFTLIFFPFNLSIFLAALSISEELTFIPLLICKWQRVTRTKMSDS